MTEPESRPPESEETSPRRPKVLLPSGGPTTGPGGARPALVIPGQPRPPAVTGTGMLHEGVEESESEVEAPGEDEAAGHLADEDPGKVGNDRPVVIAAMSPPPPVPPGDGSPEPAEADEEAVLGSSKIDEFASTERIKIDREVIHVPASAAIVEDPASGETVVADAPDEEEAAPEPPVSADEPPPLPDELPPFPVAAHPAPPAAGAGAIQGPVAAPVPGTGYAHADWSGGAAHGFPAPAGTAPLYYPKPQRAVPGWALVLLGAMVGILVTILAVRFTALGPSLVPLGPIPGYEGGAPSGE